MNGVTTNKFYEISKHISRSDYVKGSYYFPGYIEHIERTVSNDQEKSFNYFRVESESSVRLYECHIEVDNIEKSILNLDCDCPQFKETNSCKHLGACLCNYYDELFSEVTN